jgi:hypothetical protein
LWNAGLLLFNLVSAGFNCKDAKIKTYEYNISVIIQKDSINPISSVKDIQIINNIREFFPSKLTWVKDSYGKEYGKFEGVIQELNWRGD